jgi:hypothetical protein
MVGLTTLWPLSQKPKIRRLRSDAEGDFSKTFGLLNFTPEIPP